MSRLLPSTSLGSWALLLGAVACVPSPQGTVCSSTDQCHDGRVCYAGLCLVDDRSASGLDGRPVGFEDNDGDGHAPPEDCDDTDPSFHPDADDPFGDGRDTNCDGQDGVSGQNPCDVGEIRCDEACVDVETNLEHCGSCGANCGEQYVCRDGECVDRESTPPCDDGLSRCDDACVDLQSDSIHCGRCGLACDGESDCENGQCVRRPETCAGGLTNCGDEATPRCVDLAIDRNHCGDCDVSCAGFGEAGSAENCVSRRCVDSSVFPDWCGEHASSAIWQGGHQNPHLYWFCPVSGTGHAASQPVWSDRCRRAGGYLLTVTSLAEHDFLTSYEGQPGGDYWTGATMSAQDGTWVWDNGEDRTDWDPWGGRGLSGPDGEHPCGYYSVPEATWITSACDQEISAICEVPVE